MKIELELLAEILKSKLDLARKSLKGTIIDPYDSSRHMHWLHLIQEIPRALASSIEDFPLEEFRKKCGLK